jgi:hypothetical protein
MRHAQVLLYAGGGQRGAGQAAVARSLLQSPLTGPDQQVLTALAETEERLPEQTIEVRFSLG